MKKGELRIKIIFRTDLVTEEKLRLLWEYLADFPVEIQKYDYSEPIKKTYFPDHKQADENYIKFLGTILFRGKSKKSWIKLGYMVSGFSILSAYTDELHRVDEIVQWCKGFSEIIPIEYANITDTNEYDFKHKEENENSYGWEGASDPEFIKYMPGIYWFNAFGENYINTVGKDNFKDLPNCEYIDFGEKIIAFHLNEPLIAENIEQRLSVEQHIADIIGNLFFYDKYRNFSFSHPQKFIEYISETENELDKMIEKVRQKYS